LKQCKTCDTFQLFYIKSNEEYLESHCGICYLTNQDQIVPVWNYCDRHTQVNQPFKRK